MSDDGASAPVTGQLRAEAAQWFARMRGPNAPQWREEFERWLARGALHRIAYNRIAGRFADAKLLKSHYSRHRRHRWIAVAAIVSFLAIIPLLMHDLRTPLRKAESTVTPHSLQVVTVVGEVRPVRLADGSRMILDSDSLVSIRMDRKHRLVDLRRGRARFDVARDDRPFLVTAAGGEVAAKHAVFDVRAFTVDRVEVDAIRGQIDVRQDGFDDDRTKGREAFRPAVFLTGGQMVRLASRARLTPVAANRARWTWPLLRLVVDRVPLEQVVAEANRYSVQKIAVPDARVQQLRVSGSFRIDDGSGLAARLAAVFHLTTERRSPSLIVLRDEA